MKHETAELDWIRRLIIILSSSFIIILILLWLVTPAKAFIAGLLLGGIISLYNLLYLARRIRMAGQVAMTGAPGLLRGTGMFNRILMVLFAILITARFPDWIDYRSLILGLLLNFVLLIIVAVLYARKEATMKEGRDGLGDNSKD
ncbi:Na+/proline symporter [Pullulanibacillus pueri]|uniref:ATP synthase subunit I n=1 Tax=Pullulanibacillus pueri TaxID=1437324 RepID=A0A8J3ENC6_9BACL|nr:ATP synthase subunit I [Pullulanibacillus pueri]MBM7681729.1 Na+/proline symporter [Pullulanibacillus pueri]GGH84072.1 hypothetical protein GCM10007096_26300 [Pullulanibacillus pueri]